MSKERLEEIKRTLYQIIELSKTNMPADFNYLLSYISNLETAFDDLDSEYIDLQEQNKRYREAINYVMKAKSSHYNNNLDNALDDIKYVINETLKER